MFCSYCGTQVDDSARFCPKCGAQLQGGQPALTPRVTQQASAPIAGETAAQAAQSGKGKLIAIIAAIAVAVVAIVVIFFVVKPFDQGGSSSNGAPGTGAPSTEVPQPGGGSDAGQDQQGSAPSEEPAMTLDESFAQVLKERMKKYGTVQLNKLDSQVTALDGVALADLYDFNSDGTDELLLAYYDPSKNTMTGAYRSNDSYLVEVWAYDGKNAVLVHEQPAENSNGGELYVTLIENTSSTKDKMPVLLKTIEYPDGSIFDTLTTYYGFDGTRFVSVKSYEVIGGESGGGGKTVYKIDGKEVDKKTYEDQVSHNGLTGDTTPYKLLEFESSSMSWGYDVDGVKELTENTMDELASASEAEASAGGNADASKLSDLAFQGFPRDFVFSSGAGGWSTQITVQKDGTFKGQWMDSDMGDRGSDHPNGTVHVCEFEGKFSAVDQVSDMEFELQLDYLRPTHAAEEKIEDGILYIWADDVPYGLGQMTEKPVGDWHLYMPGMPNEGFPDDVTLWWRTEGWDKDAVTLNGYGLVGSDSGNGSTAALFSRSEG